MSELRVLDLFAGLGGATSAFEERGHRVVTVDREDRFDPTVCADVFTLTVDDLAEEGPYDFIWASPPCKAFTKMTAGRRWENGYPSHPETYHAVALVAKTFALIQGLDPRAWVVENPEGMMRRLAFIQHHERRTVTYCSYGVGYRKPTDLWGGFPPNLGLKPTCPVGGSCHQSSPRNENGWGTDTIRDDAPRLSGSSFEQTPSDDALRAKVPYELSLAVCRAVEAMVDEGWSWRDGTLEAYGVEVPP